MGTLWHHSLRAALTREMPDNLFVHTPGPYTLQIECAVQESGIMEFPDDSIAACDKVRK